MEAKTKTAKAILPDTFPGVMDQPLMVKALNTKMNDLSNVNSSMLGSSVPNLDYNSIKLEKVYIIREVKYILEYEKNEKGCNQAKY